MVCILILCWGCGGLHPKPAHFPSDPRPILTALAEQGQALKGLRAELSLEVWRDGERVRINEFLALDQEGRLRFDILTPFGQPMTTVVSDGVRLSVFELGDKRFRTGEASVDNLARLLPIELSPSELVTVLKGRPPRIEHEEARIDWNAERGWYRIELSNQLERQLIEVDAKGYRARRIRHWQGSQLRYDARFAAYEGEGNSAIPVRMRFDFPRRKTRVDIEVLTHEINPELPAETFILEPPRGIAVEPL